jgi:branched-chain amino acid transport system ATP-binding protein
VSDVNTIGPRPTPNASPAQPPILRLQGLSAGYGRSQVLFGVNLTIPQRGAVAVLGRNGAGKTTLMKTIVGELDATGGTVTFAGTDVTRLSTERRIRLGIGYVPQEHSVFGRLSVRENLAVGALGSKGPAETDRVLAIFPKLGRRLSQAAGTLSGGERKMLAISRALLSNPKLLLLDEPTEGVWIGVIEEIADRLQELVREMAVIVVEQHLDLALRVSERASVLDRGHVALEGEAAALRNDARLFQLLAP